MDKGIVPGQVVIFPGAGRSSGNDKLIISKFRHGMEPDGKVHVHRHHRLDLPVAGPGEEGDHGPVRQTLSLQEIRPRFLHGRTAVHGIHQRIPLIDEIHPFPAEIVDLEREDDEEFIHIGLQFPDPAFAGGPDLRSDVIEDLETGLMGEFGNPEIEPRIVDQDDDIGLPGKDVLFAGADLSQQLPGVDQNLPETDDRPIPVVVHETAPRLMLPVHGIHETASPEADVRLRVPGVKAPHQVGPVQVARGFAGDQVILHRVRLCKRFSSVKSVRSMLLGVMVIQLEWFRTWSASIAPSSSSTKSPIIM